MRVSQVRGRSSNTLKDFAESRGLSFSIELLDCDLSGSLSHGLQLRGVLCAPAKFCRECFRIVRGHGKPDFPLINLACEF